MIDIAKFNSAIGWVKNYTKIFREYLVKLRVTNRYAQKKKDSVQAVLIQPNNIGLVQYFLSSIGGWDLMCVRLTYGVQPFGSMPCRSNSLRARSFSQLPRLTLSRSAAASSCSLNSGTSLILNIGDFPAPFGLLSLFIIDMYRPVEIVLNMLGLYTNIFNIDRTTPRSATNTAEAFNHNVKRSNTMAMYKSTQTHPKFLWRFFSCQQSKYFSVEATSEQEARSMLPDSPCLFSARIRKEVAHG